MYQLRNRLNRKNVPRKPKADYNSSDDFFKLIVSAHIMSAALTLMKMDSIEGQPSAEALSGENPETLFLIDDSERTKLLNKICGKIFDTFVNFQFHSTPNKRKDCLLSYSSQILSIGLFYSE